jgi:hypothetical protein
MSRPLEEMLRQLSARTTDDVTVTRLSRPARRPLGPPSAAPLPPTETFMAVHGEIGIALEESEFLALIANGARETKFA